MTGDEEVRKRRDCCEPLISRPFFDDGQPKAAGLDKVVGWLEELPQNFDVGVPYSRWPYVDIMPKSCLPGGRLRTHRSTLDEVAMRQDLVMRK